MTGKNLFTPIADYFYYRKLKKRFKQIGCPIHLCIYCGKIAEWEFNDIKTCKYCKGKEETFVFVMKRIESNFLIKKEIGETRGGKYEEDNNKRGRTGF